MLQFYTYPPCSTCKKAKKWFVDNHISFKEVHIVEETPSKDFFRNLYENMDVPIKKLFNTSGVKYRQLDLKNKFPALSEEELFTLLASDGMLIKRPLVTDGEKITLGFKIEDFSETWIK